MSSRFSYEEALISPGYAGLDGGCNRRVDPYPYLRAVLEGIGTDPTNRIDELLPWNITFGDSQSQAAAA